MRENILMIACYIKIVFRTWFQYRVDAILRSLAVFLRESASIIVILFTFQKFSQINGWSLEELLFLFSFIFVSYGILILLFTGLRDFDYLVRSGEFDRFLLRPRGILFQVIMWDADYFAAIGHGCLGIILFLYSAKKVGIMWSFTKILYAVLTISGGVLIQGAIFLLIASFSFHLIKTESVKNLFYHNARDLAKYPINIYPRILQVFLIYIVPFAFVNYYPSQYFLNKMSVNVYWEGFFYLTPIIGIAMYLLSYSFWRYSIQKYTSVGN